MDLIQLINEPCLGQANDFYINPLWESVANKNVPDQDWSEYATNFVPVQLNEFLKVCVTKLRQLVKAEHAVDWSTLNRKYIDTLLYYIVSHRTDNLLDCLQATSLYALLNAHSGPGFSFFHIKTYLKIIGVFHKALDNIRLCSPAILDTLRDYNTFLIKVDMPREVIRRTIVIIGGFTYLCNDVLESMSIETDSESDNVAQLAFLGLSILANRLYNEGNVIYDLHLILNIVTADMKASEGVIRNIKLVHQKNARFFVKRNLECFAPDNFSLVVRFLKSVCCNEDYTDYDAIAIFISEGPAALYDQMIDYLNTSLLDDEIESKDRFLHIILRLSVHPFRYGSLHKFDNCKFKFLENIFTLRSTETSEMQEKYLELLAEYSATERGQHMLQEVIRREQYNRNDVTEYPNFAVLNNLTDVNWSNRTVNVNYVKFISQLVIIERELGTSEFLKQYSEICLNGSAEDLELCIPFFKDLLEANLKNVVIVSTVLKIIEKQILDPDNPSDAFINFFHNFIFHNISEHRESEFMWQTITYMMECNFKFDEVFDVFSNKNLLTPDSLFVLINSKIASDNVGLPASKLTNLLFNYFGYESYDQIQDRLYTLLTNEMTPSAVGSINELVCCVMKILEGKEGQECSGAEKAKFKQIQLAVEPRLLTFYYPKDVFESLLILIDRYNDLHLHYSMWYRRINRAYQIKLTESLDLILEEKLEFRTTFFEYVEYVRVLVHRYKTLFVDERFVRAVQMIVNVVEHTPSFSAFVYANSDMWMICIELHANIFLREPAGVAFSIKFLVNLVTVKDDNVRKKSFKHLYEACCVHSTEFAIMLPHLYGALTKETLDIKRFSCEMLIELINTHKTEPKDIDYFTFMACVVDPDPVTSDTTIQFIRHQYVKAHYSTVVKHFAQCIFYYNNMEYPSCKILEKDQLPAQARLTIYTTLLTSLSNSLQWRVIKHIHENILIKFAQGSLRYSPQSSIILIESLFIVVACVSPTNAYDIEKEENSEFLNTQVSLLKNLLNHKENSHQYDSLDYQFFFNLDIIEELLESLFVIVYGTIGAQHCRELLFTILNITDCCHDKIQYIFNNNKNIYQNFKRLPDYYQYRMPNSYVIVID